MGYQSNQVSWFQKPGRNLSRMSRNGARSFSEDQRRLRVWLCSLVIMSSSLSASLTSHLSSHSDVPGGFSVSQREEPTEGGDLHLTCVANKYLYTTLSWQRVNNTEDAHSHGSALISQPLTSGQFSDSLVLLLNNLTAGDSGLYRCSAHHLVTGQETHLDTQVLVKSEYCSHNKGN